VLVLAAVGPGCGATNGEGASGTSSSGGNGDSSVVDSGGQEASGVDAGPPLPTTALFVHGSPSLRDVRLCWSAPGLGPTFDVPFPAAGTMPASNYPGIPVGGAAAMTDATQLTYPGVSLYAIDALRLAILDDGGASQYTCRDLICGQVTNPAPPCLAYNADYWPVALPSGAVVSEKNNVVAISGCWPSLLDPSADVARCGPSWTPLAGNLHADVLQLHPGSSGPGKLAVQAALLSPGLAALASSGGGAGDDSGAGDDGGAGDGSAGEAGAAEDGSAADASDAAPSDDGGEAGPAGGSGVVVSFGPQDGGAASIVAMLSGEGDLAPSVAPYQVNLGGSLAAFGTLGFGVDIPGLDGGAGHVWMSLAEAQQLVDPTQDPTKFFGQPSTYLVAILGDPRAPHAFGNDGVYDGKGLHLLVVTAPPPPPAVDP
jgi:hypothetical protein